MTPQELRELITRHGGEHTRVPTKAKYRPDPDSEETQVDAITIVTKDGSEFTVRVIPADHASDPYAEERYEVVGTPKIARPGSPSTASPPPARPPETRDEGGRRYQWKPNPDGNGGEWVDIGAAPETPQEAARRKENEEKEEAKRRDQETRRNKWTEIRRTTRKDETTGKTHVVITERNELGEERQREATEEVAQAPKVIDLGGGRKGTLVPDASQPSGYRIEPIADPSAKPLPADLPTPQASYGETVQRLREYRRALQERVAAGAITQEQADREFQREYSLAQSQISEINSVAATQASVYGAKQREADREQQTANTRLGQSTSAFTNALNFAKENRGGLASVMAPMGLWGMYGGMSGGFRDAAPVDLPPFLQQIYAMRPSGMSGTSGGMSGTSGVPASLQRFDTQVRSQLAPPPTTPSQPGSYEGQGAGVSLTGDRLTRRVEDEAAATGPAAQAIEELIAAGYPPDVAAEAVAGI